MPRPPTPTLFPYTTLFRSAASPMITTGTPGTHHVEGIGTGFWPPLLKKEHFHEARAIDEGEARQTARRLAREEGIFTGVSGDRKSTRLNSSHSQISYAGFC